jgi:hypothetical protein
MSELIQSCQKVTENAVHIAERLEEVDGNIEELTEEEKQAVKLLAKSMNGIFQMIQDGSSNDDNRFDPDQSGRAFM